MDNKDVLYRCSWRDKNECHSESFSQQQIEIVFDEYRIIKQTNKTYTIHIGKLHNGKYGDKSKAVVLKDQSGKRFAYASKQRALEAFIIKRRSYRQWLMTHLENNDRLIGIAKNISEKGDNNG